MGFFISCDWQPIGSFTEAKKQYEMTAPMKFRNEYKKERYGNDCRPLGARRNYDRYITKTLDWKLQNEGQTDRTGIQAVSAFDLVLYQTVMVRYFSDGRVQVCPNGLSYNTLSSAKFLNYTLPNGYSAWMEAGRVVLIATKGEPKGRRTVIPEEFGIDIANGEILNPQPMHRLVLNRSVTKLHRKEIEPVIEQAYALAAILDGSDPSEFLRGTERPLMNDMNTPEGVLSWMVREFSARDWNSIVVSGMIKTTVNRVFKLPTRKDFNDKFYPRYYWSREHTRNVDKDPSPFNVVPYPDRKYLRASPRWYGLHSADPRNQTHPNIF